jgi:hypothetical protein
LVRNSNNIQDVLLKTGIVLKEAVITIISPFGGILGEVTKSLHALKHNVPEELDDAHLLDKDLFEDDVTQQGKDINQYSSPLFMIDTQNKIWSKIIQREKQNYQEKKKMLKNDRIALIVN